MCSSKPHSLAFSSDGSFLVSSHYNGSISVWEPSTGSLVHEIKGVHTASAVAVVPCAHPSCVVSCGKDSVLAHTDISSSKVRSKDTHPASSARRLL